MLTTRGVHHTLRIVRSHQNRQVRAYSMQQQAVNDAAATRHIETEIPEKISRTPTAILRALESTVGRDETFPGYKYVDDPYFLPISQRARRDNALAKDSGKRAAHFIIQKYPELFQKMFADPPIPSLMPKPLLALDPQPDSAVREALVRAEKNIPDLPKIVPPLPVTYETLRYLLNAGQYGDAYRFYDKLRQAKPSDDAAGQTKLTLDEKQRLLEALCFYNSQNRPTDEFLEERYFSASFMTDRNDNLKHQQRWNNAGGADRVFQDICHELDTATGDDVGDLQQRRTAAYSAMICGTAEYVFHSRAAMLFEEMLAKGMRPPVQVFNAMVQAIPYIRDSSESRWEYVLYLFSKMAELRIRPDVITFNSALEMLSRNTIWRSAQGCALVLLDEMHLIGIQPSLATWHFLLLTFYRSRSFNHPALAYDVFGRLQNQELDKVRDARDVRFLLDAMRLCTDRLRDVNLAMQLHAVVEYHDNAHLFDEALRESIYYYSYLSILCENLPLNEFFEQHYDKLVPTTYSPEPNLLIAMMRSAELQGQYQYVSRIWSDAIMFQHANHDKAVLSVLDVVTNTPVELLRSDDTLREGYYQIANDIRKRYKYNVENEMWRLQKAAVSSGMASAGDMGVVGKKDIDKATGLTDARAGIVNHHTMQAYTGQTLGMVILTLLRTDRYGEAMDALREYIEDRRSVVGKPMPPHLREIAEACVVRRDTQHLRIIVDYLRDSDMHDVVEEVSSFMTSVKLSDSERAVMSSLLGTVS